MPLQEILKNIVHSRCLSVKGYIKKNKRPVVLPEDGDAGLQDETVGGNQKDSMRGKTFEFVTPCRCRQVWKVLKGQRRIGKLKPAGRGSSWKPVSRVQPERYPRFGMAKEELLYDDA